MSTHSAIVMKTKTGYAGIYCHSDGYPSHVGAILNEHYQDSRKVAALIALGDLSELGERLEPSGPHRFGVGLHEEGVTVAYRRDRGDKQDCGPTRGAKLQYVLDRIDFDWAYVFEDGDWTCIAPQGERRPLVLAIKGDS